MISIISSAASAAIVFEYETVLDIDAGAGGKVLPTAVSCDPLTGEICITDQRQTAFHIVDRNHVPIYRTTRFAGLSYPADGTVDRDGSIVCTDMGEDFGYAVKRLNIHGEPEAFSLASPGESWSPRHLSIAANGDYLTLDPQTGLLARHGSADGQPIWATYVLGEGVEGTQLGRPAEAPDGRIYIPSGVQHRVVVISSEGRVEKMFGRTGSANGRFSFPVGVAFGPKDTIIVLDRMRAKVLVFDQNHEFLSEFGTPGGGVGHFYHPVAITSTPDQRLYVAQGFQGRVQVYRMLDTKAQ